MTGKVISIDEKRLLHDKIGKLLGTEKFVIAFVNPEDENEYHSLSSKSLLDIEKCYLIDCLNLDRIKNQIKEY